MGGRANTAIRRRPQPGPLWFPDG